MAIGAPLDRRGFVRRLDAANPTALAAGQHHRLAAPDNLSACSIQFGTAVAPGLPQRLQRMRGPLVAAMLAGHEQPSDAVPAHAAERHWTDWFVVPGHIAY
jgi:hypothetical protein